MCWKVRAGRRRYLLQQLPAAARGAVLRWRSERPAFVAVSDLLKGDGAVPLGRCTPVWLGINFSNSPRRRVTGGTVPSCRLRVVAVPLPMLIPVERARTSGRNRPEVVRVTFGTVPS